MEQSLPLFEVCVSRSVRVRQIIAAILLSIALLPGLLLRFNIVIVEKLFGYSIWTYFGEDAVMSVFNLQWAIVYGCILVAYLCLLSICSNRTLKLGTIALCVSIFLMMLCVGISIMSALGTVIYILNVIVILAAVCFYALVGCYSENDALSWIGLLLSFQMMAGVSYFTLFNIGMVDASEWIGPTYGLTFNKSFMIIESIITSICYFKMVSCGAFSGKVIPTLNIKFSFLLKYIGKMCVVLCVLFVIYWVYFQYLAPLLRNL